MTPPVTIIIPTFNNPQYFNPCVESIYRTGVLGGLCKLLIINNGKQPIQELVRGWPNTEVLEPGENLGWERGLELGLKHSDSPFVVFQNDDTIIPNANSNFYHRLLLVFNDSNVAAVGPATTIAAGSHSIYNRYPLVMPTEVSFLIFFTVMIRREYYNLAGGIDTSCPGGDDIDLSIRLRNIGKKLIINPHAFIIHHAFKTGERVHGTAEVNGGWNSQEMQERTNKWLIQKHGFKNYLQTMRGLSPVHSTPIDREGDLVRSYLNNGEVIELACGGQKTVSHAIGVDRVPQGELIPHIGKISVADITADVTQELPFKNGSVEILIARHILEHCLDSVRVLKEWNRVLKFGGQLIIAVPNENVIRGIPLNPEHVHGFTPESLKSLMEICGFKEMNHEDSKNGISFVASYQKMACLDQISTQELLHA